MSLKIGDKLPKFTAIDSNGNAFDSQNFIGKSLVIYFYPKDETRVCTEQACSFRDNYEEFKELGAEVIGISSDSNKSHQKFASKHQLPFILLSDNNKKLRKLFGVPNDLVIGIIAGGHQAMFQAVENAEDDATQAWNDLKAQNINENDVVIGNNVTVKSGVQLWDGVRIEDNVFIGPNVTFTNDKYPRSKQYSEKYQQTYIHKKASIGAAAVVLGGLVIGEYAMVAAGALVTKNVPNRALVMGSPAKVVAWLNEDGTKMILQSDTYLDNKNNTWKVVNNELILI